MQDDDYMSLHYRDNTTSPQQYPYLHNGKDVDEVKTLDLMWLDAVWTLHPRQDSHNLLSQSSGTRQHAALHVIYLANQYYNIPSHKLQRYQINLLQPCFVLSLVTMFLCVVME